MAYKFSKGSQVIGDLRAADDTQRDTKIDFGEDQIDLHTSGTVRMNISNDGVYIPDTNQDASLFVSGGVEITPGNQEGLRFMKSADELNFISFQDGTDGGSFNARMSYNSAEFLFIAPGRGADFFINSAENSGDTTFPFSIMDDGTARFEKGLTSTSDRAADLADDIAFFVSGTTDGNNNAVFIGTVVMSGALNVLDDVYVDVIRRQSDSSTTTKIRLMDEEVRIHAGNANDGVLMIQTGSVEVAGNLTASNNVIVDGKIGIGVDSPSYKLEIGGNMAVGQYIYHRNDTDTFINFTDDRIRLNAGNLNFIDCENAGSAPHKVKINNGGNNIDLLIKDSSGNIYLRADASTSNLGVGTETPLTKLDVHHDPTSLANDTGGGEVVKFGSGTLTTGKLYFLSGSTWTETDADAIATGADQMLGIALGSSPTSNGVLIKGFFDADSYLSNFSAGKAVYVSTTAGGMDTTAPSGGGDFVRIIGYCTTTANVIYFNPSTTWVEL